MKVHEYQAKEIFSTYGIPVERHALCHTANGGKPGSHKSPSADRRAGKSRRSKVGQ